MRFFARVRNLVRGVLGQWVGQRERRNPEAVYEAAIQERLEQYGKLRGAAAGVLYMRTKLAKELHLRNQSIDVIAHRFERADVRVRRQPVERLLQAQPGFGIRQAGDHPHLLVA